MKKNHYLCGVTKFYHMENQPIEANRLRLSTKDAILIVSMVVTIVGSWYSQNAQISEVRINMSADAKIMEVTIAQMRTDIIKLEAEVSKLTEKLERQKSGN